MDFITPVVDDPYQWGQIAAANSLSDVFAMGGLPLVALNVVAFPLNCQPLETLQAVMEGGAATVQQAGAFLMGGHSVEDAEPKYGLCVFGEVPRHTLWRTIGAKPGDALVLTKPLGTGIIATAAKADMIAPELLQPAAESMIKLNDLPRHLTEAQKEAVHGATDVTGFGLAGHSLDMVSHGGVDFLLEAEALPLLAGAAELADMGWLPAGAWRNRELYSPRVDLAANVAPHIADFLYDPQTSGGLLMACDAAEAQGIVATARETGHATSCIIGYCERGTGQIKVR